MLQLNYYPFELAFQYPFTTHKGTKTHQPTLVVSLTSGGVTGYGEAPAITYYNVSIDQMIATLEKHKPMIERFAITDPKRFWHFLYHLIPGQPFITCALDIAAWDLFGKLSRQPVYKLLGLQWGKTPLTDYTIGLDDYKNMLHKLILHPASVYKIKTGSEQDLEILSDLRKFTDVPFRVDANEGWTFEQAKALLPELKKLNVTMIEQPLKRDEHQSMEMLKAMSDIPFFADESCVSAEDLKHCANEFHGVNIKLTKCGGITPAFEIIQKAKKAGLRIMLGSMNESTIGTAAIAQLLPLADEADTDGPLLLAEDLASGLKIAAGLVTLSGGHGLGITFLRGETV